MSEPTRVFPSPFSCLCHQPISCSFLSVHLLHLFTFLTNDSTTSTLFLFPNSSCSLLKLCPHFCKHI
ncbi:hypothetical protein CICLE_v10033978mg [Citrus x clementina]|uniref:Uncharacterized protein n=1 Tax=Citrus clementina TaxID=85681 RepID=V4VDS4_CITCL|nr:hypothetical protein CICLE_v10033978mg [Citrus x clementina]